MWGDSHPLQPIADQLGQPVGPVLALFGLISAGLLTLPLRRIRSPRTTTLFHLYSICPGVALLVILCGRDVWWLLLQVALGYLLIRFISPRYCHVLVLIMTMSVLSWIHILRFLNIMSDEALDISCPVMISTQKLTSLAFGIHDAHMLERKRKRQLAEEKEKETAELRATALAENVSARERSPSEVARRRPRSTSRRRSESAVTLRRPRSGSQPAPGQIGGVGGEPAPQEQQPISDPCQEEVRYHVAEVPSLLNYLDFMLFFHGVLVGPPCFYPDFEAYLRNPTEERPSRKRQLVSSYTVATIYVVVWVIMSPIYPVAANGNPEEFLKWSFPYRIWYTVISMHICRHKFYFAWIVGEAFQVGAGLGYNSATKKWNRLRNVEPMRIEFATSPKVFIDSWNIQTNVWLRYLAYWRLPRGLRTISTFVLSAVWHGFYPGYYMTFLTAVPATHAARKMRRWLRPHFLGGNGLAKAFYDVVTWASTHVAIAYLVVPFMLLHATSCFRFYAFNMYWWFHILIFAILLLPLPVTGQHSARGAQATSVAPNRAPSTA